MLDIYDFIRTEESRYETEKIRVADNWEWNMRDHVQLIFHLIHSVFYTGENEWTKISRAFKNIMISTVELCNWAEDIELKDVLFFIEGKKGKVKSFFVKKYHDEVYVKKHNLDELFDQITEKDNTFGGVLVDTVGEAEILSFLKIAFCDQTDILGGPIGFKLHFSPDKLRRMSKRGWGKESNGADMSLDELCLLVDSGSQEPIGVNNARQNTIPGKSIEVYVVVGSLPEAYLEDNEEYDNYFSQVQIRAFYADKDNNKQGVCLYRKKAEDGQIKFFTSKEVDGRGLGYGVGERLLHPQIWTNFLEIHKTKMLQAGAKVPLYTDDETFTNRQEIVDMENLEVTTVADGKRIFQVPTVAPANVQLYDKSINDWYEHVQLLGDAFDPIQGKQAVSGTTFRGQERLVAQGRGNHDKRRGKRAKFIEQLYREKFIPDMVKELNRGKKFLASLSPNEMNWVVDQLAECYAYKKRNENVQNLLPVEEAEVLKEEFKNNYRKDDGKQLLEVLAGELDGVEVEIGINVAGKQKDVAGMSDKVLSIFQFILSNPQGFQLAMQNPSLAKAFDDILEFSGLSVADFSSFTSQMPMVQQGQMQPQMSQQMPQEMLPQGTMPNQMV